MPIYEYECRKCKAHVEILQKMTDKPLVKCRKCGGRLEKQWSPTSFQLKGSGWYATDYAAKKSDSKAEEKPGAPEEKSAKTDKSSGDKSSSDKTSGDKTSGDKSSTPAASKKETTTNASSNKSGD